jgi:3-oxoacyl-[acyl-carrier-protein] synthase II
MSSVAVVARGAASASGIGLAAFDVGGPGEAPRVLQSLRPPGKPFGRVLGCSAARAERPRALLELGLQQVVAELTALDGAWRRQRLGVIIGSSSGGLAALELALAEPASSSRAWAESAYFAPLAGVESTLGKKPEQLLALYAACASSTLALGLGLRWLELDYVDLVIAGGYDAESDLVCAGFDSLKATSGSVPRPFRAERDGMALGEGVALLALARHAERAHGFIAGFGATTDAVHVTAPDRTGRGLARAATLALKDAGLAESAIDFVSVHGTGTAFNDASEAAALSLVFGARASELPLHALKPVVGHTLGAAGALESLSALSALSRGVLPASASLGSPMPELAARLLPQNVAHPVEHCLKLSTAFGGANAALLLARRPPSSVRRTARPVHLAASGVAVFELAVTRVSPLLLAPLERLPRSDPLSSLAVAAAAEALRAFAVGGNDLDRLRTGVIVGSVGATLEADADFAARILQRGPEHAEPRRFPATSPNVCAGHVAIAFGLGGPSHAVGAGAAAALEALAAAHDWIAAGDADAMLVVAAELAGDASRRALAAAGTEPPEAGAFAILLTSRALGSELEQPRRAGSSAASQLAAAPSLGMCGFRGLEAFARAAGLPRPSAFGSVRAPE